MNSLLTQHQETVSTEECRAVRRKDSPYRKRPTASYAVARQDKRVVRRPSISKKPSHIVGMGGSAGSLEAFEEFLPTCLPTAGWDL
jgi:chemotaxis response regulator CheB